MTRDQRQHTRDPGVSAGHIAERVFEKAWEQTHNFDQAVSAGQEAYTGFLEERILDEFPPACPNTECASYGSRMKVGIGHGGARYYCYGCCKTFN